MEVCYIYFIIVSLISSAVFIYDKKAAINSRRRVPELTLHLLELTGGVFAVVLLMYLIRHKNRKFSYYSVTFIVLAVWIFLIGYLNK